MSDACQGRPQLFLNRMRASRDAPHEVVEWPLDAGRLSRFFDALRDSLTPEIIASLEPEARMELDATALGCWFAKLRNPMAHLRKNGGFSNPWEVARLGRDEVRNTAVLAWLIDPLANHGLGDILLRALLERIHRAQPGFPVVPVGRINVTTEVCPEEDQSDRVDIEIRCESFYVLIEVKIDAPEGREQLARYGRSARNLALSRPWALVFLTRRGGNARSAGNYAPHVLPLTWRELSYTLQRALELFGRESNQDWAFSSRLAELYLRHVRTF